MKKITVIMTLLICGCYFEALSLNVLETKNNAEKYSFEYYPKFNIYFSKTTKKWFILNGCSWIVSKKLPKGYKYLKVIFSEKENISSKTFIPFEHHLKCENHSHKNKIVVNSHYNPSPTSNFKFQFTSRKTD